MWSTATFLTILFSIPLMVSANISRSNDNNYNNNTIGQRDGETGKGVFRIIVPPNSDIKFPDKPEKDCKVPCYPELQSDGSGYNKEEFDLGLYGAELNNPNVVNWATPTATMHCTTTVTASPTGTIKFGITPTAGFTGATHAPGTLICNPTVRV
ncbi:uncharacterized protein IL334_005616 [Kwoniella shivajii]|uniref:Phosphatidylglycerol/phosphatidylinositol transfer protein n=1 Tax=Kwoniella shivajii TaxID=564305 RepID=A0ABZ1D4A4_9TREE|nr:hypothetical protein IL334_005616 [Kwoniella shivajii]